MHDNLHSNSCDVIFDHPLIFYSCFPTSDDRRSVAKLPLLLHHPQPRRVDQVGGRDEEGRRERRQDRQSGAIRISENYLAFKSGQFIIMVFSLSNRINNPEPFNMKAQIVKRL